MDYLITDKLVYFFGLLRQGCKVDLEKKIFVGNFLKISWSMLI